MNASPTHTNRSTNEKPPVFPARGATVTQPSGSLGLIREKDDPNTSFSHKSLDGRKPEVCALSNAYALAAGLAQPVARGYLTLTEAHASLLATALQADRKGQLEGHDVRDIYRGLQHILSLRLEAAERLRDLTAHRIARRLKPLIALRKPPNVLFAEAHDVNGAGGFPFDESDVNDITKTEMYWSLPAGRQSHGR